MSDIIPEELNKAAEEKGLGDIQAVTNNGMQPIFTIQCDNTDFNKKDAFKKLIKDELKNIVKKGISKIEIRNLLRTYEQNKNDEDLSSNRGVDLNGDVMSAWLYGGEPIAYLNEDSHINLLKEELKGRYLEDIIQKYILDNKKSSFVTLKEKPEASDNDNAIDTKNLSEKQLEKIEIDDKSLKKWQAEASSEKATSKLPVLKVSDIKYDEPHIQTNTNEGVKTMFTPVETDKSSYYDMYFDTSMVAQDKIPYINLLCYILTNCSDDIYNKFNSSEGTEDVTYGNIQFWTEAYSKYGSDSYLPKIKVSVAGPENKIDKSISLLKQLLTQNDFGNKDKLKEYINQAYDDNKSNRSYYRFLSYLSEKDRYNDKLMGLDFCDFLKDLSDNFASKSNDIEKNLTEVYNMVFNKNNMVVGFIGSQQEYSNFKKEVPQLFHSLQSVKYTRVTYKFDCAIKMKQ